MSFYLNIKIRDLYDYVKQREEILDEHFQNYASIDVQNIIQKILTFSLEGFIRMYTMNPGDFTETVLQFNNAHTFPGFICTASAENSEITSEIWGTLNQRPLLFGGIETCLDRISEPKDLESLCTYICKARNILKSFYIIGKRKEPKIDCHGLLTSLAKCKKLKTLGFDTAYLEDTFVDDLIFYLESNIWPKLENIQCSDLNLCANEKTLNLAKILVAVSQNKNFDDVDFSGCHFFFQDNPFSEKICNTLKKLKAKKIRFGETKAVHEAFKWS